MEPLVIESATTAGATVLSLIGMADMTQAPVLNERMMQATEARPHCLIIDLTRLTFLASVSIAALMRYHHECRTWKGSMIIAGANDDVFGTLRRARLNKVFTIVPTLEAAMAAVDGAAGNE
jgi:anti-anti-sigma factor